MIKIEVDSELEVDEERKITKLTQSRGNYRFVVVCKGRQGLEGDTKFLIGWFENFEVSFYRNTVL